MPIDHDEDPTKLHRATNADGDSNSDSGLSLSGVVAPDFALMACARVSLSQPQRTQL